LATVDFSERGLNKLRDNLIVSIDSPLCGCDVEIHRVASMVSRYCDIDSQSDNDVIALWRNIFELVVSQNRQREDISLAKQSCEEDMNQTNWERLKELKINQLQSKKKDN
jgi:hypothetical protein